MGLSSAHQQPGTQPGRVWLLVTRQGIIAVGEARVQPEHRIHAVLEESPL